MTLQQLRYAIGISKVGSFNKAAESLFISQPSLTTAIHDLEDEIGITIFNRTSRGVTLTPEGEEFIARANELYNHYTSVLERYSEALLLLFLLAVAFENGSVGVVKLVCAGDEFFAFGRECHTAARAIENRDADFVFEVMDSRR